MSAGPLTRGRGRVSGVSHSLAPALGSVRTATVRPGIVTVPVAASHTVDLTTGSVPCAWIGESR